MDLSTRYLGFELPHPLMPASSPLADDLDVVRRLEDAGAAAIVMRSLFEEQIVGDELTTYYAHEAPEASYAEALSYLPEPGMFALGTHEYLEQLQRIKAAVSVPVTVSGIEHRLSASIGIALGQDDADTLLREADAAVYRAKAAGGARVEIFSPR